MTQKAMIATVSLTEDTRAATVHQKDGQPEARVLNGRVVIFTDFCRDGLDSRRN
jgi:hypothetical protein